MPLEWPTETVLPPDKVSPWYQTQSNCVLDFHGDPQKAELAVLSDGNHHMALGEALKLFYRDHPEVQDIFYATTPPSPIIKMLKEGGIRLGNLVLAVRPHIFISPPEVLDKLQPAGLVKSHQLLASNQGSVLLITRGNPKHIRSVGDLMRKDVRLFISNPDTETVSYKGYYKTLKEMAIRESITPSDFQKAVFDKTVVFGERIHHREAPEALADGRADVAIIFYHLALRYTRIFPDHFDFLPLGGSREKPRPHSGNQIGKTHIGIIGDGGKWGQRFHKFMLSSVVSDIYASHGLCHAAAGTPEEV